MTVIQSVSSLTNPKKLVGGEVGNLFRAARVSQVLRNFSSVFASQAELSKKNQQGVFGASHSDLQDSSGDGGDEHQAADELFFNQTVMVDEVDFFISHVWTASRWEKALALHYYVNISFAVFAALTTCFLATMALEAYGRLLSHGHEPRLGLLVTYIVPLLVYMFVFLAGHMINPWALRTAWLDKLCVHQTRRDIQLQGIAALPDFVTRSKRLVILHSPTYFERLWCNLEVATFCAVCGPERVDFLPLWLVRWQLQDSISNIVAMLLLHESYRIPGYASAVSRVAGMLAGPNADEDAIFEGTVEIFAIDTVTIVPILVISYFAYWQKIRLHQQMTQQLREYDFETLKCSVEADRELVRKEVERVFEDQPNLGIHYDGQVGPVARLNHFMKYEFRHAVSKQIGFVNMLPYWAVLLTNMPCFLILPANVSACSGNDCNEEAKRQGFESLSHFFLCGTLTWIISSFFVWPCVHPVGLAGLLKSQEHFAGLPRWQTALGVMACFAGLLLANTQCGLLHLVGTLAFTQQTPMYIILYILISLCFLGQCHYLYATTSITRKLRRIQFWFTVRETDWTYHHV